MTPPAAVAATMDAVSSIDDRVGFEGMLDSLSRVGKFFSRSRYEAFSTDDPRAKTLKKDGDLYISTKAGVGYKLQGNVYVPFADYLEDCMIPSELVKIPAKLEVNQRQFYSSFGFNSG